MVINPYWLWESEVSGEICDQLIKEVEWKNEQPGLIGGDGALMLDLKTRKTKVVFERWTKVIGSILFSHIYAANISAGWNFKLRYPEDTQIGVYSDKGHYDWHQDLGPPSSNNHQRKLSAVLILSNPDDYEGGELLLKSAKPVEEIKFKLPKGSVIVFPSFIEHKVNVVTAGERYSAVMWVDGPAFV
jgi:PKHD-type hydroxylase